MVILGGAGSQAGVVLGAIVVSVLLEVLRDPGDARVLFYAVILLGLVAAFRLSLKLGGRARGHDRARRSSRGSIADGIDDAWTAGVVQ